MGAKHRKVTWSKAARKDVTEGGKRKKYWEPCVYRTLLPLPSCPAPLSAAVGEACLHTTSTNSRHRQCRKENMQTNTGLREVCRAWGGEKANLQPLLKAFLLR